MALKSTKLSYADIARSGLIRPQASNSRNQTMPPKPPSQQRATPYGTLTKLPPELREMIFGYVFTSAGASLTRVSKAIHADTQGLLDRIGVCHLHFDIKIYPSFSDSSQRVQRDYEILSQNSISSKLSTGIVNLDVDVTLHQNVFLSSPDDIQAVLNKDPLPLLDDLIMGMRNAKNCRFRVKLPRWYYADFGYSGFFCRHEKNEALKRLVQSTCFETLTIEIWDTQRSWNDYIWDPEWDDERQYRILMARVDLRDGLSKRPQFVHHPPEPPRKKKPYTPPTAISNVTFAD